MAMKGAGKDSTADKARTRIRRNRGQYPARPLDKGEGRSSLGRVTGLPRQSCAIEGGTVAHD